MKTSILVVAFLSSLGLAQDAEQPPRYACPEIDIGFTGNDITMIPGVNSWEDCGKKMKC